MWILDLQSQQQRRRKVLWQRKISSCHHICSGWICPCWFPLWCKLTWNAKRWQDTRMTCMMHSFMEARFSTQKAHSCCWIFRSWVEDAVLSVPLMAFTIAMQRIRLFCMYWSIHSSLPHISLHLLDNCALGVHHLVLLFNFLQAFVAHDPCHILIPLLNFLGLYCELSLDKRSGDVIAFGHP